MWQCQMFHGKWVAGISAGGRGQYNPCKLNFNFISPKFSLK